MLDNVDDLLKAICDTFEIEEKVQMPKYNLMYQGMHKKKSRVFPVNSSLLDTIKLDWGNPERKPFFPSSLKRRFPFDEDMAQPSYKYPKVDTPL